MTNQDITAGATVAWCGQRWRVIATRQTSGGLVLDLQRGGGGRTNATHERNGIAAAWVEAAGQPVFDREAV